MTLEEMPVEIVFIRKCRCGETSQSFDQYAECPGCRSDKNFATFRTEPLSWAMDRAMRKLRALGQKSRNL